jgi:hypothetical protein
MDNPSINHPLIGTGRAGRLVGFRGLDGTPTHKTTTTLPHTSTKLKQQHKSDLTKKKYKSEQISIKLNNTTSNSNYNVKKYQEPTNFQI